MAKKESSLFEKYSGPLRVIIKTPGGCIWDACKDFREESTLFEYVGEAAANIFTNLTTRLAISTAPEDWEIQKFSPTEGILIVKQIGGEPLEYEEDDPEKFQREYGLTLDEARETFERIMEQIEIDEISLN